MLALHSEDVNDHKQEVLAVFDEMTKAGIDWRNGRKGECVDDLDIAGRTAIQLAREVQAEKAEKAAG